MQGVKIMNSFLISFAKYLAIHKKFCSRNLSYPNF